MARLPRLNVPGCAQHVIQRGNNREACFYAEADYKACSLSSKTRRPSKNSPFTFFVLTTNHAHSL